MLSAMKMTATLLAGTAAFTASQVTPSRLGVADRFYVGPEAVRVFPLRLVTKL